MCGGPLWSRFLGRPLQLSALPILPVHRDLAVVTCPAAPPTHLLSASPVPVAAVPASSWEVVPVWVSIVDLGLLFSCFPFCLELRRRRFRVQVGSRPVEPLDSVFLSLPGTLGSTLPGCETTQSTGNSSLRSSSGEEQNARF